LAEIKRVIIANRPNNNWCKL